MSTEFDHLFDSAPKQEENEFAHLFDASPPVNEFYHLFAKAKPRDAITKALQDANLFGSATSAMKPLFGGSGISKMEDGRWDLPIMTQPGEGFIDQAVMGIQQAIAGKVGLGNDNPFLRARRFLSSGLFANHDPEIAQGVFRKLEADGLTPEEIQSGWSDMVKLNTKFDDGEQARVLSDNTILPNYSSSEWLDDEKAEALIEAQPVPEESKRAIRSNLKEIQNAIALAKLEAYAAASVGTPLETPHDWADRSGRLKDFGSPAFVKDYEEEVSSKAGWGAGLISDFHQGNIKLANTLTGLTGFITGSESVAEKAGELSYASSLIGQGAFNTGIIGSAVEELPSLFVQVALTRGIGAGASAVGLSESAALKASTIGAVVTSGAQSAGMTFSSEIADGSSIAEAREKATKAGVNTAIITGLFQISGMGGFEAAAVKKNASNVTIRDLMKTMPKAELAAASKTFAGQVLKSVAGESTEEGLNELSQAFLTADPDTNLADAWDNAIQAAKVGGLIGGVADVVVGEIDGMVQRDRLEDRLPKTAAELEGFVDATRMGQPSAAYTRTAIEKAVNSRLNDLRFKKEGKPEERDLAGNVVVVASNPQSLTVAEEADLKFLEEVAGGESFNHEAVAQRWGFKVKEPISVGPKSTKPGNQTQGANQIPAVDGSGRSIAESVFGPAKEGFEYRDNIEASEFVVAADGRIWHKNTPTSKVMRDGAIQEQKVDGQIYPSNTGLIRKIEKPSIETNEDQIETNEGEQRQTEGQVLKGAEPPKPTTTPPFIDGLEEVSPEPVIASSTPQEKAELTPNPNPVITDSGAEFVSVKTKSGKDSKKWTKTKSGRSVGDKLVAGMPEIIVTAEDRSSQNMPEEYTVTEISRIVNGDKNEIEAITRDMTEEEIAQARDRIIKDNEFRRDNGFEEIVIPGVPTARAKPPTSLETDSLQVEIEKTRAAVKRWEEGSPAHTKASERLARLEGELAARDGDKTRLMAPAGQPSLTKPKAVVRTTTEEANAFITTTPKGSFVLGDETAAGPLQVGSVILTTDGTPRARVVTHSAPNSKGVMVHKLSEPYDNSSIRTSSDYAAVKPVVGDADVQRVKQLGMSLMGVDLSIPGQRDASLQAMNAFLQNALASITTPDFAAQMFQARNEGPSAQFVPDQANPRIELNTVYWAERLRSALIRTSHNPEMADAIAADWVAEVEATLWHEANHESFVRALDYADVVKQGKALIGNAESNPAAAAFLAQRFRGRFAHAFNYGGGAMANFTDEQVLAFLRGETVDGFQLEGEALDNEIWAISAEVVADLMQNMRSGMDPAAMRDAFDRFVDKIAGDATKADKGKLASLLERFAELANRAMEAMKRFMDAHRLARTLPPAFFEMSLAVDSLMQSRGFRVPDVTDVLNRYMRSSKARMAQVGTVEERLKDRFITKDGVKVKEWEVKRELRSLMHRIGDRQPRRTDGGPDFNPVTINPTTGLLEPDADLVDVATEDEMVAIQDALNFLNDPRRSMTAKDAADAASDLRLVLRNLNGNIPLTPSRGGVNPAFNEDIFFDEASFERAAPILNENLEVALESRVGFSPQEVLDVVNDGIVRSLRDVAPAPADRVSDVLLDGPLGPYAPYASIRSQMDENSQEANRLDLAAEVETDPAQKRAMFLEAGELRWENLSLATEADSIVQRLLSYKDAPSDNLAADAENTRLIHFRDEARRARLEFDLDYASFENRQAARERSAQPFRTIADLADASLDLERLRDLLAASSIDPARLDSALRSMREVRSAFTRLRSLPDELEWMLVGGPRPSSLRQGPVSEEWSRMTNLPLENADAMKLLPFGLPRSLRGNPEEGGLVGLRGDNIPSSIIDEDGSTITFETGDDFDDSNINESASRVRDASLAASRVLGFDNSEKAGLGIEKSRGIRRNARALARSLSTAFRRSMIWGDPAANEGTVANGGFAGFTSMVNGEERSVLPERVMNVPDAEVVEGETGKDGFRRMIADGSFAKTLVEALRFMNVMEGRSQGVSQKPVLWHSGGMTPSGLAYSLVAPRALEMLALTKGMTASLSKEESVAIEKALMESLTTQEDREVLRDALQNLRGEFETASIFQGRRSNIKSGNVGEFNQAFWGLREMAVAGNTIYQESLREASRLSKVRIDEDKEGSTDDSRPPLDEALMRSTAFELNHIRNSAARLGPQFGGTAVSLLRPVSALESLDLLDSLEAEQQKLVNVRGKITEGNFSESDMRLMLEGGNQQENTDLEPMSDQMTNQARAGLLEHMKRQDEALVSRQERFITQHLLAFTGNNRTLVRRIVNDPMFTYFEPGSIEMKWNRKALLEFLRGKLEEVRAEELSSGTVISSTVGKGGARNARFDEVIKDIAARTTNRELKKIESLEANLGLEPDREPSKTWEENRSEQVVESARINASRYQAVLDQILASGGSIHSFTEADAFTPESQGVHRNEEWAAHYSADATSVLTGLLGRIANTSIITGRVNWQQTTGDLETRVPSVVFVPDPLHPTLLLPYGQLAPTEQEAQEAIVSVLEWMVEHGKLDIMEAAAPLIEQLSTVSSERSHATVTTGYRKGLDRYLRDMGFYVVTDAEWEALQSGNKTLVRAVEDAHPGLIASRSIPNARFESAVEEWARSSSAPWKPQREKIGALTQLDDALSRLARSGVDLIDPNLIASTKDSQKAAINLVALALSNSAVKEVLLLSTFEPNFVSPTQEEIATFGDLVSGANVRGIMQIAYNDLLNRLEGDVDVEDSLGRGSKTSENIGRLDPSSMEALEQAEAIVENTKGRRDLPGLHAVMQAEWANANLYHLLRQLHPQKDPSAPMLGNQRPSGLTEWEARQLLSVFGDGLVAKALHDRGLVMDGRWGSADYLSANAEDGVARRPASVNQIMAATGDAAQRLREMFSAYAYVGSVPGNAKAEQWSREALENYGHYGFTDPLRSGATRNEWESNRIQKGALAAAENAGVKFVQNVDRDGQTTSSSHASIVPDLEAMEAEWKAKGILKKMYVGYDEAGRPLGPNAKPDFVFVTEAMRRSVAHDIWRDTEFIAAEEKKAHEQVRRHQQLQEAMKATKEVVESFDGMRLASLISRLESDPSNAPSLMMASAFRSFAESREDVAYGLADDLLRNFEGSSGFRSAFGDPLSPLESSVVGSSSVAERIQQAARRASVAIPAGYLINRFGELDLEKAEGEGRVSELDTQLHSSVVDYNRAVTRFFDEAESIAPDLFNREHARRYRIGLRMNQRTVAKRLAVFKGRVNRAADPASLREMAIKSTLDSAVRTSMRIGSPIGGRSIDLNLREARFNLPASAQSAILEVLGKEGMVMGDRPTPEARERVLGQISSIIFKEVYDEADLLADAKRIVQPQLQEWLGDAENGKLRQAMDVMRVISAVGRQSKGGTTTYGHLTEIESGMLRQRAVAQLISNALQEEVRQSATAIRTSALRIAESKSINSRLAGFRLNGYASLQLRAGEVNGKRVTDADVEVARRTLEQFGHIWNDLYMNRLGKSEFRVGLTDAMAAAEEADALFAAGAGSFHRKGDKSYRITDGILEPEDARERVEAILRLRRSKERSPLVMARLKWQREQFEDQRLIRSSAADRMSVNIPEMIGEDEVVFERNLLQGAYSRAEVIESLEERIALTKEALKILENNLPGISYEEFVGFAKDINSIFLDDGNMPLPGIFGKEVNIPISKGRDRSLPSKAEYRALLESPNTKENMLRLKQIEEDRSYFKSRRNLVSMLERRLEELEAEVEVVSNPQELPSLFAPAPTPAQEAIAKADADAILRNFSPPNPQKTKGRVLSIRHGILSRFEGKGPRENVRDQLRYLIERSSLLVQSGALKGHGVQDGIDLHQGLRAALGALKSSPRDPERLSAFYKMQAKALPYAETLDDVDALAAGYVQSASPHEKGWYYRSLKNASAKIKAVFAKSLRAQDIANGIRSKLYRGQNGEGGKDRAKINSNREGQVIEDYLKIIHKDQRYTVAARGLMLAQLESHFLAGGPDTSKSAERALSVFESALDGLSRAVAASKAERPSTGSALGDAVGWVPKKFRQMWQRAFETGFRQLDNRATMLDMLKDVVPLLERVVKDGNADTALQELSSKWGDQSKGYAEVLFALFSENASSFIDMAVIRGANPNDFVRKPIVPFIWSNQSHEAFTADTEKSVGEMLSMDRAKWLSNPQRTWDNPDKFDLLDFDGITAPIRVLADMNYRAQMAPAYDAVAAMIGDVSTDSDHFSGFAKDDAGVVRDGYVSSIARERHENKAMSWQDMKKAQAAALALSNMVRDEITNDMLGFSPASRAINLYRKIAIIGLGRKLISLVQPIAQTVSPVAGYVAANGKRGMSFIPTLLQYNLGKLGPLFGSHKQQERAIKIDRFVEEFAPVVSHRDGDNIHMLGEMAQESRIRGQELMPSPVLGSASGVVGPVIKAAGAGVDAIASGTGWALQQLIGKPEGRVIKPQLAHEVLWAINENSPTDITMDQMLDDPIAAGVTPEIMQRATVRVEELFGPGERAQKGKFSQPANNMLDEIFRSLFTTLAGHPINMAAMSDSAWRMLYHNKWGSPESKEGLRLLFMTVAQNMTFVALTGPTATYLLSHAIAAMMGDDEEERREMEGRWYGIEPGESPDERRKKLAYWAQILISRNEDPYGYSWHKGEWSDEQAEKHDGYRRARFAQEIVNQLPYIGSLTSTTLGGSALGAAFKATGISPDSTLQQAGVVLPEKWGFTGTADEADTEAPLSERALYQATKFWTNYLNDSNSMAFSIDALVEALKMASNNPNDLDGWDALMIGGTLLAPKPREIDRGIERAYSMRERDEEFKALAPWR